VVTIGKKHTPYIIIEKEIPPKLIRYTNIFSIKNIGLLLYYKETDYVINIGDKALPYRPLYNLSIIELIELRCYLYNKLIKGRIRYLTSLTRAPILFIPKKDRRLRLYIDY